MRLGRFGQSGRVEEWRRTGYSVGRQVGELELKASGLLGRNFHWPRRRGHKPCSLEKLGGIHNDSSTWQSRQRALSIERKARISWQLAFRNHSSSFLTVERPTSNLHSCSFFVCAAGSGRPQAENDPKKWTDSPSQPNLNLHLTDEHAPGSGGKSGQYLTSRDVKMTCFRFITLMKI